MLLLSGPGRRRRSRRARPRCRPHRPGHRRSRPRSATPVDSATERLLPRAGSAAVLPQRVKPQQRPRPQSSAEGTNGTGGASPPPREHPRGRTRLGEGPFRAPAGPGRSIRAGPVPPPPGNPVAAAQGPGGPQRPGSPPPVAGLGSPRLPVPGGPRGRLGNAETGRAASPRVSAAGGPRGPPGPVPPRHLPSRRPPVPLAPAAAGSGSGPGAFRPPFFPSPTPSCESNTFTTAAMLGSGASTALAAGTAGRLGGKQRGGARLGAVRGSPVPTGEREPGQPSRPPAPFSHRTEGCRGVPLPASPVTSHRYR